MFEILIILILTAISCGIIGSLLVIKDEAMITDALSHSVLLGIVLGFFISDNLNSPILILFASLFGLMTILFIEYLIKSPKINHDAATGLVFPLMFSIAVILISKFAKNVHIDIDMVLMGEILFAPLNRIDILFFSLPINLVYIVIILIVNLLFISIFYNRLKLYLLDKEQAKLYGVNMTIIKIISTALVAMTTVTAFNIAGSISVICFFVAPTMANLFIAKSYKHLLYLNIMFSIMTCSIALAIAIKFDLNISSTAAFFSLILFIVYILIKKLKSKII